VRHRDHILQADKVAHSAALSGPNSAACNSIDFIATFAQNEPRYDKSSKKTKKANRNLSF
jgi:hypothetical protein